MTRIALVDDNPRDLALQQSCLTQYAKENGQEFDVRTFPNGLDFLERFDGGFDIIFMDVEMPHMNGVDVARRLRRADPLVVLVFVTNMAQYAICGYEVNAIDYLLKPVRYFTFAEKLNKALSFVAKRPDPSLVLAIDGGILRLKLSDIIYLEKDKNYIIYHTAQGEYRDRGSMTEIAEKLADKGFSKCTAGCLVNLDKVTRVGKEEVWLGQVRLPLARPQRKSFSAEFLARLGGE